MRQYIKIVTVERNQPSHLTLPALEEAVNEFIDSYHEEEKMVVESIKVERVTSLMWMAVILYHVTA